MKTVDLFCNLYTAAQKVKEADGFFTIGGEDLSHLKEFVNQLTEFKDSKITYLTNPEGTVITSNYKHMVLNKEVKLYSISVIEGKDGCRIMFRLTPDSFEIMR